eukprot:TRINITY_DN5516_c0_g1_i1.p1 TRINITY_DN5516_c0_g1~~TRINITY_DN5516_c0_g1_i1.p1  ORF type:complete len:893 (+),score=272.87 TRINITY_DN5516_c0_g1_i1:62-2740(+)
MPRATLPPPRPGYYPRRAYSQREAMCTLCVATGILFLTMVSQYPFPVLEASTSGTGVVQRVVSAVGSYHPGARPGSLSTRPLNDTFWTRFHDVSIVYTWVNGSDEAWGAQRQKHGARGSASRYRDTEELLHSLRSFTEHWRWHTGTIFLLTPGHWPWWVNSSHPRVKLVSQYDVIPEEFHPIFNSAVVEQHMWKIPGLTEQFIHVNDDYLFGRRVHPSDLFTDKGGVRVYLEGGIIRGGKREYTDLKSTRRKQWLGSVFHTNGVLNDLVGPARRYFVKHAPFVYNKRIFERAHKQYPEIFKKAGACRFRSYDDILVPFLHQGLLQAWGKEMSIDFHAHNTGSDLDSVLCIVKDDTRDAHRKMVDHLLRPHMFFTVNDGWSRAQATELVRSFLHAAHPRPSPFEQTGVVPQVRRDVAAWSDSHSEMQVRCAAAARGSLDVGDSAAEGRVAEERGAMDCGLNSACSGHGRCTQAGCVCNDGWCDKDCGIQLPPGAKTHEVVPRCAAVDVVFTYVNGSDAAVAAAVDEQRRRGATDEQLRPNLIRDLGQLRFGLRSVHENMPWVRHIWVLTGSAPPSWLRETAYLTVVPHSAVFSASELPVLGSNAIQSRIHRIPKLAFRYLSMDDDYLIIRSTPPAVLLGESHTGTRQWWRGLWQPGMHKAGIQRDAMMRAKQLVDDAFAPRTPPQYTPAHVPPLVDKLAMAEMQHAFGAEMKYSTLRESADVEPNFAYAWFVQGHVNGNDVLLPSVAVSESLAGKADPSTGIGGDEAVTVKELLCRAAGRHASRPTDLAVKLRGCVSSTDASLCAKEAAMEAAFNWQPLPPSEAAFAMLEPGMNLLRVQRRLLDRHARVSCLNDDFGAVVPEREMGDVLALLRDLFPRSPGWETDKPPPIEEG